MWVGAKGIAEKASTVDNYVILQMLRFIYIAEAILSQVTSHKAIIVYPVSIVLASSREASGEL